MPLRSARSRWAGLPSADIGVVLAELGLPFPDVAASSRWIEAARSLERDPAGAAELYREIGSEPDEADARLRAAQLLLAADRSEEAAPHLKAALDFYRSVDATTRIASAETLLTSA